LAQRIAIVGSGYVGSVAAACFAHIGHHVVGVERDPAKLALLARGRAPLREPGLDALLGGALGAGSLSFTADIAAAMGSCDFVFLCVGTPPGPDGRPEMGAMEEAAREVGAGLRADHVVVTKSTVPIGTGRWLADLLGDELERRGGRASDVSVVSNPEFLREGRAVDDFLHPDRVVVGSDEPAALARVVALYGPIVEQRFPGGTPGRAPVPMVATDLVTSEMTKYASNAFLATKISFANEIAALCEVTGADVALVTRAMGLDPRIAPGFLEAGLGWGGSCLGKDLRALVESARVAGYRPALLEAVEEVNAAQRGRIAEQLRRALGHLDGARVGILGLAFKADTDDVRDSPGLDIARRLLREGCSVAAFDPLVGHVAGDGIEIAADPVGAVSGADAIVVTTDAERFRALDLRKLRVAMRGDVLIDGRAIYGPEFVRAAGLRYFGIGRDAGLGRAGALVAGDRRRGAEVRAVRGERLRGLGGIEGEDVVVAGVEPALVGDVVGADEVADPGDVGAVVTVRAERAPLGDAERLVVLDGEPVDLGEAERLREQRRKAQR
jgi:nucleotide sugar dehydrogenase